MLEVVAGPPFSGKSEFVASEIKKRGERNVIAIDFSQLFRALFPGDEDAVRDAGAGVSLRIAAYLRSVAVDQAHKRELDGYITAARKELAAELAEKLNAPKITVIEPAREVVVKRAKRHVGELWKLNAMRRRYASDADISRNCDEAIQAWYADAWGVPESMLHRVKW